VTDHVFPPTLDLDYRIVDGRIATRALEAHVVDDCNLTCAECCSYSPHLPRWRVAPDDLAHDLVLARRVVAPRVFKLVGGEPLLHPSLVELVEIARRSEIAPIISLTTNGLLLPRMPDALWSAIDAMTISLYPAPSLDVDARAAIEERAARFDVALNWKVQDRFVTMNRDEPCNDAAQTTAIFSRCWLRERCHMVRRGRFYTCTRPPHLQAYLGGTDFERDGVALDGLAVPDLLAYLRAERPLSACAHCRGGDGPLVPHRLLTRDELVRLRR
jgi:hypothetical protein